MSFASSLSCTLPVGLNVIGWPLRTLMPVGVHGWVASTVIAPATAGVDADAPVVPAVPTALSGRAMTMRATSFDEMSRSPSTRS